MRMGHLTTLMSLASLGGLVSLRAWGGLCDRFGNKPVMFAAALFWALTALPAWLLAGPDRYWHLYATYFLTGFMTAGFQLCQFNLMLKMVPAESKAHYISVFLAATSLMTAAGPLVGGKLLSWLPHTMGTFLSQPALHYHVVFCGSLVLGLVVLHALHLMSEPAERPAGELIKVMGSMREFNPMLGFASLASFLLTPRGLSRFAHQSLRSLKRQGAAVSEVGEDLFEGGLRVLGRAQPKPPTAPVSPAPRPGTGPTCPAQPSDGTIASGPASSDSRESQSHPH
jgi:MFS family permease